MKKALPPPALPPPSKQYIAKQQAARALGGLSAPAPLSMGRAEQQGITPCGVPPCLLPWPKTACSPGCYCRTRVDAEVADSYPQGFGWYSMSVKQDTATLKAIADRLEQYDWAYPDKKPAGGRYVRGSAAQIAQAMHTATKVAGASEKVPAKIRGIFWMKGNAIGEELVSLQYGDYHAGQRQFLFPVSPYAWAWPTGVPATAPFSGIMYTPAQIENASAIVLNKVGRDILSTPVAMAFAFKGTPDGPKAARATMDTFVGNPRVSFQNGWGYMWLQYRDSPCMQKLVTCCSYPVSQTFTLDEYAGDESTPGSSWWRGILFGCFGVNCVPFGGYHLVKILDGDGQPVQPYYDQFIAYMGDVGLFTWAGDECPVGAARVSAG